MRYIYTMIDLLCGINIGDRINSVPGLKTRDQSKKFVRIFTLTPFITCLCRDTLMKVWRK